MKEKSRQKNKYTEIYLTNVVWANVNVVQWWMNTNGSIQIVTMFTMCGKEEEEKKIDGRMATRNMKSKMLCQSIWCVIQFYKHMMKPGNAFSFIFIYLFSFFDVVWSLSFLFMQMPNMS